MADPIPHTTLASPPGQATPPGAWDCHIHINDPAYPYVPGASLTPPPALLSDYQRLQQTLGLQHVVIVQPSSYGVDNTCTLDSTVALAPHARAIVCISPDTPLDALDAMHAQGARGVRLNFTRPPTTPLEDIVPLARKMADLGWHLQVHGRIDQLLPLFPVFRLLPCPLVFDHLGRIPVAPPHPGFDEIKRLIDAGNAWIKLSCAYYTSPQPAQRPSRPAYPVASALMKAYLDLAPDRMVWGSNWPHPASSHGELALPDDAHLLDLLAAACGSARTYQQVLCDNPQRLYA